MKQTAVVPKLLKVCVKNEIDNLLEQKDNESEGMAIIYSI